MPSRNEQLAKLIRFLRLGEAEGVNTAELPFIPSRQSERKFAFDTGVTQATVRRWEEGKGLDRTSLQKLANRLGKTPDELSAYLAGERSLTEFLQGVTEVPRSRRLHQILAWMPEMEARELYEIVQMGFKFLSVHFHLPALEPLPRTIQGLIEMDLPKFGSDRQAQIEAMAQAALLEPEELQRILMDEKPTEEQVIALSSVLQNGSVNWDIEVLKSIVYNQYGCCKKENENHV